jgi:glycosyltransferase involved in cell wall biosynthesis
MKLSVLIPCRNGGKTLGQQLEAVCAQEWADGFEIIVVDNHSTDDSASVVRKYQDRFDRIHLVAAHQGLGRGYALNCGIRESTGDAIVFCDADDEVAPGWLCAMGQALREHDFVAGRIDLSKLNDPTVVGVHAQSQGLQRIPYPPYLPHAGGGTIGIKRWLHDVVGGFDETFRYLQDTHYCLRIQLAGHSLHFVPEAVIHVRMRDRVKEVFRQARQWGQYSVRLYRTSRRLGTDPLPNPWRLGFAAWRGLLYTLPHLRTEPARRSWVSRFGYRTGRLLGSIRYRTLAP